MHTQHIEHEYNQEIIVLDTTELFGEKGHFRVMQFYNEAIQGAIDLDQPERVLFEYPKAIIHLMELNDPSFEDMFVIGHGVGTIPRYFSHKRCKVAELNTAIVNLSRQYFGYTLDNVTIGDGREILEAELSESYDYIILDAFTEKGTPHHLVSLEFFKIAFKKLDSQGFILVNLIGRSEHDPMINAIYTTISHQFPYVKSFSLPSDASAENQNMLIVGGKRPIKYQSKHLSGFNEIELGFGYIIRDQDF